MAEFTRQFTNTPASQILTSIGSLVEGAHTLVAIIKYEGNGNIIRTLNALDEELAGPTMAINGGTLLGWGGFATEEILPPSGSWSLVAVGKGAGTVKPRQHLYNFLTKVFTHRDQNENKGEGSKANWSKYRLGGKLNAIGPYKGAIAAIAVFAQNLTDKQIEELVSAGSIGAWLTMSPAPIALWEFKQASVAEELLDLVGTANQTERKETSVLEEAPPIPYLSGKFVKVLIGGVVKEVKRWILVKGELLSK